MRTKGNEVSAVSHRNEFNNGEQFRLETDRFHELLVTSDVAFVAVPVGRLQFKHYRIECDSDNIVADRAKAWWSHYKGVRSAM